VAGCGTHMASRRHRGDGAATSENRDANGSSPVSLWSGILQKGLEESFQADQARTVVWVQNSAWCPPVLALLRGRTRAKILRPWAVLVHVALIGGMAACKVSIHTDRRESYGLVQSFVMSGWLLYSVSNLLLPMINFSWLSRLGPVLVCSSAFMFHHDHLAEVRPSRNVPPNPKGCCLLCTVTTSTAPLLLPCCMYDCRYGR
jgi:hypothetical protein